jgi:hypothetical protein
MSDDPLANLIEDARALIDADRRVVEAVAKSNLDALSNLLDDFGRKRIRVLAGLAAHSAVEAVDPETQEILSRVQGKFPTERLIETLTGSSSDLNWFDELSDTEQRDLGSELLYSWISHYEYVRNIFKVNTLILTAKIPSVLRVYLDEARNCFALQQHNAAIAMCRTILEAAAKDLCERKGLFQKESDKIVEINPKVFHQLIKAVARGSLKRRAVRLYFHDACPVVHGDRSVGNDEALRVLRETTSLIQELYSAADL